MIITVENGLALFEDGTALNLIDIQRLLCESFQDTGEPEYAFYADQLSLITGVVLSAHGQEVPRG